MRSDLKEIPLFFAPSEDLINLATNENHYSTWNDLINSEMSDLILKTPLHRYGTSAHNNLVSKYANYVNLANENILPGPGSDSIIPLLVNALTTNNILTLNPEFFRYDQAAAILSRDQIKINISANMYDDIINNANTKNVDLIFISNPNNPLGIIHTKANLLKILDNTDCYVVIDEAYAEYSNESVVDLIEAYDKLIVLKTLSKAWGLARLRVGFALANANLIKFLKAVQGPFILNDISSEIAALALDHEVSVKNIINKTIEERNNLISFLEDSSVSKIYNSNGNFVYIEHDNAQYIQAQLLENNIAIAYFKPNGLRITIGTPEQMHNLKLNLKKLIKE